MAIKDMLMEEVKERTDMPAGLPYQLETRGRVRITQLAAERGGYVDEWTEADLRKRAVGVRAEIVRQSDSDGSHLIRETAQVIVSADRGIVHESVV